MARFCTSCGHSNPEDGKFCEECGSPFAARPLPTSRATSEATRPTGDKPVAPRKFMPSLIGASVVIVGAAGGAAWYFGRTPAPSQAEIVAAVQEAVEANRSFVDNATCIDNLQYGRSPIAINANDKRATDWMAILVGAGLYGPPEQRQTGGFFPGTQLLYQATDDGRKRIRNGRLCFADGVKVKEIVSVGQPAEGDPDLGRTVSVRLELVAPQAWVTGQDARRLEGRRLGGSLEQPQEVFVLRRDKRWVVVTDGVRRETSNVRRQVEDPKPLGGKFLPGSASAEGPGVFERLKQMLGFSSGPSKVAKAFIEAMDRGDVKAAKGMLSTQLVALMGEQKLEAALKSGRSQRTGNLAKVEVLNEQIQGERAKVTLRIHRTDNTIEDQSVVMVLEGGEWKIGAEK